MPDDTPKQNGGLDLDRVISMMEMAKLMQSQTAGAEPEGYNLSGESESAPVYVYDDDFFDAQLQSQALRSVKAAIPHIDQAYRRNLTVFIKLMEIQRALRYYDGHEMSRGGDVGVDGAWRREMLKAMIPHCKGKTRTKLESMLKLMDMSELIIKMREMDRDG